MLQFRKALESIAFGSLVANREAYASAHADFAINFKLKNVLKRVHAQNPRAYPQPVIMTVTDVGKHIEGVKDGFLTRDEMEFLHDRTGDVLHTWNPYKPGAREVDIQRPFSEWLARLQRLLDLHVIALLDGGLWLVQMNVMPEGRVHAFSCDPA
ncbi:MAG TPA: hypothetical protein VF453_07730 [Burkholderiaceae bacterium]